MHALRQPHRLLILLFLGMIALVPVSQAVLDLARGELPQALDLFSTPPTARALRAYEKQLERNSWWASHVRPWAQWLQLGWLGDGGDKAVAGRDGWVFYRPGVQYLTERPNTRDATGNAAAAARAIIDFRDQLAARGIALVVVPVPNKESVYPDRLTGRAPPPTGRPTAETRAVFEQLAAASVEVVDLFALFAQARTQASDATQLYLARDSHWSPDGLALAARAVADRLLALKAVTPGTTAYANRPVRVERVGDIVRMFQSAPLERRFAPEPVDCRQVRQPDGSQPYRDDPGAPVLVLGDSFLRIFQQDEPGAAGFIAHLARELRQPVKAIVDDGGASTAVRQELSYRASGLRGTRVVVWEFVERDIRLGREGWKRVPFPAGGAAAGSP